MKVTHSWWWNQNSIQGCLTAKTLVFPSLIHLLIHSTNLFLTLANAIVLGAGDTERNKMDMVLVLTSSHSGVKTDPSPPR